MAGSKTRFGFSGGGSEPPDSDESRAARTILGHDIHLQLPSELAGPQAPGTPAPLTPARVRPTPVPHTPALAPIPEEITEEMAAHRPANAQKSRLARFLGRWTKSGRFVSSSHLGDAHDENFDNFDDDDLPRNPIGRHILLVVAVALLTFLLVVMVVKVRQHFSKNTDVPSAR